ncbi:unnamed protein product [Adineta ricciae]|uniref:FAM194 C-terminal domain-containing protein n=1 Tax=Adineta ricciae TaxID=249248 RepID=A0A815LGR6_ADIRI|nr:unnamed protein product [Adineta ricciae]CAF1472854.1 unnamed protein product [Adineta ricciae]
MSSESYFYDQSSPASRLGGIYRSKRNLDDLNQALCQAQTAVTFEEQKQSQSIDKTFGNLQISYVSDIILKELDSVLPTFDIQQDEDQSKISLPSSLILQLHSSWNDLIKNTEYKQKIWRTKAGEDAWRHYLQRRRFEQNKLDKRQSVFDTKVRQRRKSSRISVSSATHRRISRGLIMTPTIVKEEPYRVVKPMMDNSTESIKNGVHVEFKFSTQILKSVQKIPVVEPKFIQFDVEKSGIDFNQEVILSIQKQCKRLLAETKQKILSTTDNFNGKHSKTCQVWFYDDNPYMRNKNNLLLLNESSRQKRAKFVLSIVRREIPEKYNINIEIPETKKKCYVELPDGSSQIYYPSGRLAVLRLRSSISTTLFFDDTSIPTKQFLGLINSSGNVLVVQPAFHTRFVTNNHYEYAYLCNGKTGIIENQLQWSLKSPFPRQSTPIDEDTEQIPIIENTVQFQLNSFMQLEYNNPTNIRFAFICLNEQFKYQLGNSTLTVQSPLIMDSTTTAKRNSRKRISSINAQDFLNQKSTEEQVDLYQLSIMKELFQMRKRIKILCDSWLKEYRTVLGIMDIDSYCFADLSSSSTIKENQPMSNLPRRASLSIQANESAQFLRRSTTRFDQNVITQSIEQFIPHSDVGQAMKQRIYSGKRLLANTLPIIK